MKPRRPLSVTILGCLVLIVTMANWVQMWLSIKEWDFLVGLLPFSPAYLALSGLFWGLAGSLLTWGLWRGKAWAPRSTRLATPAFSLYYWANRLLLAGYTGRNANWPFVLTITLILVAWSFWKLSRPRIRNFFGEMDERKSENQGTA
jgi:hypothetical protein